MSMFFFVLKSYSISKVSEFQKKKNIKLSEIQLRRQFLVWSYQHKWFLLLFCT